MTSLAFSVGLLFPLRTPVVPVNLCLTDQDIENVPSMLATILKTQSKALATVDKFAKKGAAHSYLSLDYILARAAELFPCNSNVPSYLGP